MDRRDIAVYGISVAHNRDVTKTVLKCPSYEELPVIFTAHFIGCFFILNANHSLISSVVVKPLGYVMHDAQLFPQPQIVGQSTHSSNYKNC